MSTISRRSLTKGAAWTVPAVAVAAAAPAVAKSYACPPDRIVSEVNAYFTSYINRLPDLKDVHLNFSFHMPMAQNGFLTEQSLWVRNLGTKELTSQFPLDIQYAVRNVGNSPVVDDSFDDNATVSGAGLEWPIYQPWNPNGLDSETRAPGDAVAVGVCDDATKNRAGQRRDFSFGSSYLDLYDPVTGRRMMKAGFAAAGETDAVCIPGDTTGAYGFTVGVRDGMAVGAQKNWIAMHIRDGAYRGGRIYVATGVRVRGFFPPTWEDLAELMRVSHPEMGADEIEFCYYPTYVKRLEQWYENLEGMRNMRVTASGWGNHFDKYADIKGWTRDFKGNEWMWSNEVGNFMLAGREGRDRYISGVGLYTWSPNNVNTTSRGVSVTEIRNRDGIF